ncbi:hypothetical protein AS593_23775 [Caulobacter vibrioides]|nr:hypothetical protein AS593_23775 [Caulobacter vibrioides]
MAKAVAQVMGLTLLRPGSNEVRWRDGLAVIKSCGPGTSSFGVTVKMLPRIDAILAAFEAETGRVEVFELPTAAFRAAMYDSRSSGAAGRVKMVSRTFAKTRGVSIAHFSRDELEAAGRD